MHGKVDQEMLIGRARLTYDELLTALTKVEMILNSRPLSYISSDDPEEPLTPSHLMMGRKLLILPDLVYRDDGDEDYSISQGALNKRIIHFSMILNHFWRKWKKEYLLSLRDCHRYSKEIDVKKKLCSGDIVVMCNDASQRGFWRLARVEKLIHGIDGQVREADLRVLRGDKRPVILRHPVTHLYPLK